MDSSSVVCQPEQSPYHLDSLAAQPLVKCPLCDPLRVDPLPDGQNFTAAPATVVVVC